MTCIVALRAGFEVVMGADSAGGNGYFQTVRADPKIYKVGAFTFGYTTSFRMGQVLGYGFVPPQHASGLSVEAYMATAFIDAMRATMKAAGIAGKKDDVESCGTFLVVYRQRIFRVDSDYQVGENTEPFDACGSGEQPALGSLFTSQRSSPGPSGSP